jgi:chemotaxis protein CheX
MLLTPADEVTETEMVDAVGELANMVAGAAKARLEAFELSVSLPSVITGKAHTVRFPSNVTPICVPFETGWGPLTLEVGMSSVMAPVGA